MFRSLSGYPTTMSEKAFNFFLYIYVLWKCFYLCLIKGENKNIFTEFFMILKYKKIDF